MKLFKWFGAPAAGLVLLHFIILLSGNQHFYKTLQHTIFKGRLGPAIDEYSVFANRAVETEKHEPWRVSSEVNKQKISPAGLAEIRGLETVAYLVIKDNEIVHEEYWEGYSKNSHSNSFSMAKSILNIAVGALIYEGKIHSLDDPVSKYLPELNVDEFPTVSIRHLLQMSSGIDFDENYINPFAYPAKANYGDDLQKLTFSYKATEEPGRRFEYRSGNSQLLSFIISRASGMPTSEYVSERIWKRMGAKNAALWSLDKENGYEKGFCCFNSNARDFARIGKLFLNKGVWNSDTIVSEKFVEESLQAAPILDVNDQPCERYGLHWWLHTFNGNKVFYARGILGQYIAVVPALDLIVVRLGHKRIKPSGVETPRDLDIYLKEAFAITGLSKN